MLVHLELRTADRIVVRADLPTHVEEVVILVGRGRLLDILRAARSWDLARESGAVSLSVDGVPVVFEDGSDGSWVTAERRLDEARV